MVEPSKGLNEQFALLYLGFLLSLLITTLAARLGFYTLQKKGPVKAPLLVFRDVLGAFTTFLLFQVVFVPIGAYIILSLHTGTWLPGEKHLSLLEQGWVNLASIVAAAGGLWAYCFLIEPHTLQVITGPNGFQSKENRLKDFLMGSIAWIVSFPLVFSISQGLAILVTIIFSPPLVDQVAVRHLKMTYANPPLFWATIIVLISIVPILEEVIFRGFLQNWLKRYFARWASICIASIIFALFHYSTSQGWHNIDLLVSLFVLSCYLGFIYERQQSIWASIGLHSTFNFFSICMIVWGTK